MPFFMSAQTDHALPKYAPLNFPSTDSRTSYTIQAVSLTNLELADTVGGLPYKT